ncbi:MAG: hypothetical protein JSV69_08785, partial [Chloroflexota bacterium]
TVRSWRVTQSPRAYTISAGSHHEPKHIVFFIYLIAVQIIIATVGAVFFVLSPTMRDKNYEEVALMQGGFGVMELLICSVVLAILSVAVAVGVILIVRFVQRDRNKEG